MRFNHSLKSSSRRQFQLPSWSVATLEPRLLLAADAGAAVAVDASSVIAGQPAEQSPSGIQITRVTSVAFIDAELEGVDVLAQNLSADTELVLLDPQRDLIQQISQTMARFSNVSQVHLLTHGNNGVVILGDKIVDSQTLWQRADQIRQWSDSMTADADILVYGCNSGAGDAGQAFITALARLTQADVAASTNVTGARNLGGDWNLELQLGKIEAPLLATACAREQFGNTLDIVVNAWGRTGQESFDLLVDDQVVQSWEVQQTWQPYVYQTGETISADRVKVEFTNDLYDLANGVDRNLHVDNVVVNGQTFQSESSSTFSTGTWLAVDGRVEHGFGRGDTLHANGFFQYDQDTTTADIQFAGRTWIPTGNQNAAVFSGTLALSTDGGDAVLWTQFDVSLLAGDVVRLTSDGLKQSLDPPGSEQLAYASVGIDFRNAAGNKIGDLSNSIAATTINFPDTIKTREIVVPAGTTQATLWIYVQDKGQIGRNVQLVLNDFTVEKLDFSADTTPPTAELNAPAEFTEPARSLDFTVIYRDDTRLTNNDRIIRVTGPGGYDELVTVFSGFNVTDTERTILYGAFPRHQGDWDSTDNGVYTVSVEPNALMDVAGNIASVSVLGTFEVNIEPSL